MSAPSNAKPPVPICQLGLVQSAPAVTVLLCVHNGEKYLAAAVQSILDQTFTDFEFLIINDGSSDQSLHILDEFARKDARIRILSRANRGLTVTLNEGILLARGEFIARMDSDDLAMPDRLARQVDYLQHNPSCVMVGSRVLAVDPQGNPIREICTEQSHEQIDQLLMNRGWPLVHPAVTIRTDALKQIGGYDESYRTNQDHDLFLRLAEYGRVANLPQVLLHYRQHFKSISMGNIKKKIDPLGPIVEKARTRRGVTDPQPACSPSQQPTSNWAQYQQWGWAALANGYIKTARKQALASIFAKPLSPATWRLVYCALRGC